MVAGLRLLLGTVEGIVGKGDRHLEGGVLGKFSATAREGVLESTRRQLRLLLLG